MVDRMADADTNSSQGSPYAEVMRELMTLAARASTPEARAQFVLLAEQYRLLSLQVARVTRTPFSESPRSIRPAP